MFALWRSAAALLLLAVVAVWVLGCRSDVSTPVPTATPQAAATPRVAATPQATVTPQATTTPQATATPRPTATPGAAAPCTPVTTPASAATPTETLKEALRDLPALSGTPAEAVFSVEESPLIMRFGLSQGSVVPRLIAPEGDVCFSWRFPEPPIDWRPDRPWVLYRGDPVTEPAPWMLDAAAHVLATLGRYHTSVREHSWTVLDHASQDPDGEPLADLYDALHIDGEPVVLVVGNYDYGGVAISLDGEDEARAYGWTYGINFRPHRLGEESLEPRLFDADFTDHTVTYLQRGADGHWRLTWHGSALDAELIGEEVGRGDVLLGGRNEVFLSYYALNASARRALAVPEFEDYWLDRDERPPAARPVVVRPGAGSPPPTASPQPTGTSRTRSTPARYTPRCLPRGYASLELNRSASVGKEEHWHGT